jgi:hypothetical protein
MTSTLAVFVPHFDDKGTELFRDALPSPWEALTMEILSRSSTLKCRKSFSG